MDDLIELLRQRCLEKPGVTIRSEDRDEFGILDGSLDMFVQLFLDEPTPVLMVRCGNALRKKLATRSSSVSVSDRMKWKTKGWKWTDVVLDGSIPPEVLLELIDHSYQLLHDELDDVERLRISMLARAGAGGDPLGMDREPGPGGSPARDRDAPAPAFLLRTSKPDGSDVPRGRTKIGGEPDLPEGQAWPVYRDGKPLAFLAQVNLSELPDGVVRGGLRGDSSRSSPPGDGRTRATPTPILPKVTPLSTGLA